MKNIKKVDNNINHYKQKKYKINGTYILSNIIQQINFGARRHVRFVKIFRSQLSLRIVWLLYKEGLLRTFVIRKDHILVYYKYYLGRNAFINISLVSTPGNRCY
jgi:ribosomal protein S8